MTKTEIARAVKRLAGTYRVRTKPGWGCWVWEYKRRGDDCSRFGWHSVCPLEMAEKYFGFNQ